MAFRGIFRATISMMADACERPHVVHGPYNRLAAANNLFQAAKRYETLINPVKMDNVCLPESISLCYVDAGIGYVDIEDFVFAETVGRPYRSTFLQKTPLLAKGAAGRYDSFALPFRIANHHGSVDTLAAQGFQYAPAGNRCASGGFRCVDKQYLHKQNKGMQ
jgi:hypothetical protein